MDSVRAFGLPQFERNNCVYLPEISIPSHACCGMKSLTTWKPFTHKKNKTKTQAVGKTSQTLPDNLDRNYFRGGGCITAYRHQRNMQMRATWTGGHDFKKLIWGL